MTRHTARTALLLALLLIAGLAAAQSASYGTLFGPNVERLDTSAEIRVDVHPYSDEVFVRATLIDGPRAGTVLTGVAGIDERLGLGTDRFTGSVTVVTLRYPGGDLLVEVAFHDGPLAGTSLRSRIARG